MGEWTREPEQPLQKPVQYLKGVGDKLGALLAKKNVRTIEDALFFFPRTYEDRRQIYSVAEVPIGRKACVFGRLVRAYPVHYSKSRRQAFEVLIEDTEHPEHRLTLKWFHRPYVLQKLESQHLLLVTGEVQYFQGRRQMLHPELELLGRQVEEGPGIIPIYSQTEGLFQKTLRKIERSALDRYASFIEDSLPEVLLKKHGFPVLRKAVEALHFPDVEEDFSALLASRSRAHQRLIYEEFFYFNLHIHWLRRATLEKPGIGFKKPERFWQIFKENLPFQFTAGQKRAAKEILEDMQAERPMLRLLQGDVGCGKTAVSAAAALIALESGYQVAFMAPTEVLVDQHLEKMKKWFAGMEFPVLKLTGSLNAKERKLAEAELAENSPAFVCGTHALFEDRVKFKQLGLVIVDEQHRFGVDQRARLTRKGESPDLLVMTATPIPRTLALTIYGDLDISTIPDLPPGRMPVKTEAYRDSERTRFYPKIRKELGEGRQIYWVFPLIEESEALTIKSIESFLPALKSEFSEVSIEVLHGRMSAAEKSAALRRFESGDSKILVSTTVIEVGVDVPNASVMVVENAERFGLSQLHQLRGRVGRGVHRGYCYLVSSQYIAVESMKRLRALEKVSDGFKLSELDLEWRGPGELAGVKQTGLPEFKLGELPRDLTLFHQAKEDALQVLAESPDLKSYPKLRSRLDRHLSRLHLS